MFHKSDLQVFYSKPLDTMVLRVGAHQWILEKDLQIIGTRSKLGGWQCYCLPNPGGFFLLKIVNQQFEGELHPELVNLETILSNRTNFKRVDALEGQFNFFHEKPAATSGFEALKENVFKAVEKIEEQFISHEGADHANNKIIRPMEDLLSVDSIGVPMADFNEHELTGLKGDIELIIRDHQNVGTFKEFFEGHPTFLGAQLESLDIDESQRVPVQTIGTGQQIIGTISQDQLPSGTKVESHKSPNSGLLNEEKLRESSNLGEKGSQEYTEAPQGRFHHDHQEVLGGELQRLPGYEVDQTSKEVHKGFKEASANLGSDSTQPAGSKKEDETEFTTGLLKGDIEGTEPSPKTPYHKNEELNPPVELKPNADLTKRIDLPKESLDMAKESWGSNVSNPSESNPSLDTDFSKSNSGIRFNTTVKSGSETRFSEKQIAESSEKINEKETAGAI